VRLAWNKLKIETSWRRVRLEAGQKNSYFIYTLLGRNLLLWRHLVLDPFYALHFNHIFTAFTAPLINGLASRIRFAFITISVRFGCVRSHDTSCYYSSFSKRAFALATFFPKFGEFFNVLLKIGEIFPVMRLGNTP